MSDLIDARGQQVASFDDTVRCAICTWRPNQRLKLVNAHLDGRTYRTLATTFPASRAAIHKHITRCEAGNVARQRLRRHRAIDWKPILTTLSQTGDDLAGIVRTSAQNGDVAAALSAVSALTANIEQRIEIADRVRKLEHDELGQVIADLAAAFVLNIPHRAAPIIAGIIENKPAAQALLQELHDEQN